MTVQDTYAESHVVKTTTTPRAATDRTAVTA